MGMAVILFYACKKENQILKKDQVIEYTPEALNIWNRLNTFNQKLKGNNSRENILVPADSVVWYLESMLNIQLSVDTSFCDSYKYENSYTANVDEDGYVAMSELTVLFNTMVTDIESQLNQIDSDYKYLIIADLYEETSRTGNLEIALDGICATTRFQSYTAFTSIDNWYYGHMLGRSDGAFFKKSDGGQQLKIRINNQGIKPTFQYNNWLNIWQSPNNIGNSTNNRMYYEEATSAPIISYTEMTTLLMSMHYLVYNSSSDIPSGYFPTGVGNEDMWFKCINFWTNEEPPGDGKYWHGMNAIYGEPVYIPEIE